jgi:predicted dehydrogenase
MEKQIVTGILSYGMSGRVFHAPFIDIHPGFKLYAVTERTKKQAGERYPEIKSFDTVDELIANPYIELIIVNTPNNTHYQFAKQALLAGKHVLVDKPFTTSVEEAKELFELSKSVDRKVMVYQNRRWNSDFLSVKEIISSGALGKLIEVHFRFDRYKKEIGPKKFKETLIPGSGVSFDLGSHLLDQAITLFGKPLKFFKTTSINRKDSVVDDYVFFHLVYPDQLNVFLTASLLVAEPLPAFVLHGTNGSYLKERSDVQEAQLIDSISPLAENFGQEETGKEGRLTIVQEDLKKSVVYTPSLQGNYKGLFDAVYNSIQLNYPFPVKEDEIIWQIELLSEK